MKSVLSLWRSKSAGLCVGFGVVALIVVLGVGALVSGCGSSPSDPSGQTLLRVELTDAPIDELSQVNVYITGLTIKRSGQSVERILGDVGEVDLLTLQNTSQVLVVAGVEPGVYEFIRVDLDESRSSVVEIASGERKDLKIPSEEIKVLGGWTIEEASTTTLLLDFDVDQSIKKLGNGEWLLEPVILLQQVS